ATACLAYPEELIYGASKMQLRQLSWGERVDLRTGDDILVEGMATYRDGIGVIKGALGPVLWQPGDPDIAGIVVGVINTTPPGLITPLGKSAILYHIARLLLMEEGRAVSEDMDPDRAGSIPHYAHHARQLLEEGLPSEDAPPGYYILHYNLYTAALFDEGKRYWKEGRHAEALTAVEKVAMLSGRLSARIKKDFAAAAAIHTEKAAKFISWLEPFLQGCDYMSFEINGFIVSSIARLPAAALDANFDAYARQIQVRAAFLLRERRDRDMADAKLDEFWTLSMVEMDRDLRVFSQNAVDTGHAMSPQLIGMLKDIRAIVVAYCENTLSHPELESDTDIMNAARIKNYEAFDRIFDGMKRLLDSGDAQDGAIEEYLRQEFKSLEGIPALERHAIIYDICFRLSSLESIKNTVRGNIHLGQHCAHQARVVLEENPPDEAFPAIYRLLYDDTIAVTLRREGMRAWMDTRIVAAGETTPSPFSGYKHARQCWARAQTISRRFQRGIKVVIERLSHEGPAVSPVVKYLRGSNERSVFETLQNDLNIIKVIIALPREDFIADAKMFSVEIQVRWQSALSLWKTRHGYAPEIQQEFFTNISTLRNIFPNMVTHLLGKGKQKQRFPEEALLLLEQAQRELNAAVEEGQREIDRKLEQERTLRAV
ncbi:MAG: hypothetical protein HY589_00065, partial [Candidatus Omnitrophica bacterium]|nr:hypothetical protein [Candidatus Omnitrophota bacterium]